MITATTGWRKFGESKESNRTASKKVSTFDSHEDFLGLVPKLDDALGWTKH